MSELTLKSLLHAKLNTHIESMPEPSWPQSVFMPVTTDIPKQIEDKTKAKQHVSKRLRNEKLQKIINLE